MYSNVFQKKHTKGESPYGKNIIKWSNLKEIERDLFQLLQKTFGDVLKNILEEIDQQIADKRDKKRFYLKGKRETRMDTTFGTISFKRNDYKDRQTQQYVYLLDPYLEFEGTKGFSPMIEGMAMEMAVNGPSYRHASAMLEKLLGYSFMSHDATDRSRF